MPNSKDFKQLLDQPNRSLAYLYGRVEQQKKLLTIVRGVLPDSLQAHAIHCVIDRNKLIIYTDSANWASQLRFYRAAILGVIHTVPDQVVDILQFKISEPILPSIQVSERANLPALVNIGQIRETADARGHDALASALLKLCDTLERQVKAREKNQ